VAENKYDQLFRAFCAAMKLPLPEAEYRFHPVRKHRLDFAWPDSRLGLEVEGGVWTRGRHGRGSGIVKDMEKANLLAELGWRLLRVTPKGLYTVDTKDSIDRALKWRTTEAG
jgi:very-short-patch-repair endonuclease